MNNIKSNAFNQDLEDSNALLDLVFESASNHIVVTDPEGSIVRANLTAQNNTGYSEAEMKGKTTELWSEEGEKDLLGNIWNRVKEDKKPFVGEIKSIRKNGELYTAIIHVTPILKDKLLLGFVETEDVVLMGSSEEKAKQQTKLITAKQQGREVVLKKVVLDSIEEGIVVTDSKGRITLVNRSFERLIGWYEREVIGKDMLEVLPKIDENGDSVPRDSRSLYKVITGQTMEARKSTLTKTHSYLTRYNEVLPITGVVTPIIYNKQLIGAVQVFRVVSKEKESEKLKDDFVSMVSHELRTPLTAIDGLVSMMIDGEYGAYNDKFKQPLQDIALASQRLILLVNDLLSISRIQAKRLHYDISEFDVGKMIRETVSILRVVAKNKGLSISVNTDKDVMVCADVEKTKQILNNLIGNAIKFTDTGSITITYRQLDNLAQVSIKDTGIGIADEDQGRLFGKFEQLGNQKGRQPGTGLGLLISKEMAQKMGGNTWLDYSKRGKGSTFCFTLPIAGSNAANKALDAIKQEANTHPDQK